ncbi:hypothetical protein, partial [Agrobacterium vitis]|uniref:hypothetical protein n=1 Tax=Agrobacterium vitis TaxID=373 RepID=UPI0015741E7D
LSDKSNAMRLSLTLEDKAVPYFHFIPVDGSPDDPDEGQCGEIEYQSAPANGVAKPSSLVWHP